MTALPKKKELTPLEKLELEVANDPTVSDEFRLVVKDIRKTEDLNNRLNKMLKYRTNEKY